MMSTFSDRPGRLALPVAAVAMLLTGMTGPAAATRQSPNAARGAYYQAEVWHDVGHASRVVAGGDGKIYVLNENGIGRMTAAGELEHQIPAPALRELAVDGSGTVYAARAGGVTRLREDGGMHWTQPLVGTVPSPLVGEVPPYVASLAWDSQSARAILLFDRFELGFDRYETLLTAYAPNGVEQEAFDLAFPTHSYWDIDFRNGEGLLLNRARRTIEVYRSGFLGGLIPPRGSLDIPAERIAAGPHGTLFLLVQRRYVYRINDAGEIIDVWDATDPEPGGASSATDVAVDASGNVYVTDPDRRQVRVYGFDPALEPGTPPTLEPRLDQCQIVPDKYASPTYLLLGEKTKVTLRLDGSCPERAEKADVMLVVDRSFSMSHTDASGRQKIVAAQDAVRTFVGLMDLERDQVGLVTFESVPELRVALTHNGAAVERGLGFAAQGGTDIAAGIDVALAELTGARRRPDAKPIMILLTDGNPFNTTRLTTVAASDRARYHGITMYTVGLGDDADPELLRVLAKSPEHYFFAPTAAELEQEYRKIARHILANVLLKTVTIVDEVPDWMEYQDDGTASPPPIWDADNRTLTWTFTAVGFDGIEMSYWLKPLMVGEWETNITADYEGTDGLDQPQTGPFPIPKVIVVAPTSTPTITTTPTITNTPEPTATGTLPPTATFTVTPSPTQTPTQPTPTPSTTPSPAPSPTQPDEHKIYLMIVFNNQCFRRYTDVVLVIDASTTMLYETPDGVLKLDAAKTAAWSFLNRLQLRPDLLMRHDQAAIVWYNDSADVGQPLTTNRDALELAVDAIEPQEGTRIDLGIQLGHRELLLAHSPRRRLANTPVLVLLSDGIPNRVAFRDVLAAADAAKDDGIEVYTVGFGADVNEHNLRRIASQPGMYFYAPTASDLQLIYERIAGDIVCR